MGRDNLFTTENRFELSNDADKSVKRLCTETLPTNDSKKTRKSGEKQGESPKSISNLSLDISKDRDEGENVVIEDEILHFPENTSGANQTAARFRRNALNLPPINSKPDAPQIGSNRDKKCDYSERYYNFPEVSVTKIYDPSSFYVQQIRLEQKINRLMTDNYEQQTLQRVRCLEENRKYIYYCAEKQRCYRCFVRNNALNGDKLPLIQGRLIQSMPTDKEQNVYVNIGKKLQVSLIDYDNIVNIKLTDR